MRNDANGCGCFAGARWMLVFAGFGAATLAGQDFVTEPFPFQGHWRRVTVWTRACGVQPPAPRVEEGSGNVGQSSQFSSYSPGGVFQMKGGRWIPFSHSERLDNLQQGITVQQVTFSQSGLLNWSSLFTEPQKTPSGFSKYEKYEGSFDFNTGVFHERWVQVYATVSTPAACSDNAATTTQESEGYGVARFLPAPPNPIYSSFSFTNPYADVIAGRRAIGDVSAATAVTAPAAVWLAADGRTAAVAVFRSTSDGEVTLTTEADGPLTLSHYTPGFLKTPLPGTLRTLTLGPDKSFPCDAGSTDRCFAALVWAKGTWDPAATRFSGIFSLVTAAQGDRTLQTSLVVQPPPLALIHGVWSQGAAWSGFRDWLLTRYPHSLVELVDYREDNFRGFNDQRVWHALERKIADLLNGAAEMSFAARTVDVVGHSMGGLVTRWYQKHGEPQRFPRPVRQLITVGTPHQGSALATELWTYRDESPPVSQINPLVSGLCSRTTLCTLSFLMKIFGRQVDSGVESLQPESNALAQLGTDDGNYYAIAGEAAAGTFTENVLNTLIAAFHPGACTLAAGCVRNLLGDRNDTIVPLASQYGKAARKSVFDLLVHTPVNSEFDVGEPDSVQVWGAALNVLMGGSGLVAASPAEVKGERPAQRSAVILPTLDLTGRVKVSESLVTFTPASNSALFANSQAVISATSATKTISSILLIPDVVEPTEMPLLADTETPFAIPFTPTRLGAMEFMAFALFSDNTYTTATLRYTVQASGSVALLSVSGAPAAALEIGRTARVRTTAHYTAVGAIDVTKAATYQTRSGSADVFSVDATGLITAVGPGADWLDITYGGKAAAVAVEVGACSYRAGPMNQIVARAGGTATVQVKADAGCKWTAVSNDGWLSVTAGSGTGDGTITVSASANASGAGARTAIVRIGGAVAAVTQPDQTCSYAVVPSAVSAAASGASGTIAVTTACPMVATSSAEWAIPTNLGTAVAYTVRANPTTAARTAILTIGTTQVTVNQQGQTAAPVSISGGVSLGGGGQRGVAMALSGSANAVTVTDASGNFAFAGLAAGGNYRVAPMKPGYTFLPPSQVFPSPQSDVAAGTFAARPRGDLSGDSRTDVLIYDPAGNGYSGLSNGSGGLSYTYTAFTPNLDTLRLADINGDGREDLVLYNSANAAGYLGTGTGSGTFQFASLFWGPGFDRIQSGDLNGDGKADFVLHRTSDGTMYTAISNGSGGFAYKYTLVSTGFSDLMTADFDGDGRTDVLFYRRSDGLSFRGISDGGGGFTFTPVTVDAGFDRLDTGDVSADGKADVLFYRTSSGVAKIGLSGANGFVFSTHNWSPGFSTARFADTNGDGKADLILYNRTNTLGYLGVGMGNGGFVFGSLFWGAGMEAAAVGDLNADGRQDVVIYNAVNGAAYTCLSTGTAAPAFNYSYHYWGNGKVTGQ